MLCFVSILVSSAKYRGFTSVKPNTIRSTLLLLRYTHSTLPMSKGKYWLVQRQDNECEWVDIPICEFLMRWAWWVYAIHSAARWCV